MMRAVTSGFFRVAEAPYPVSSFDELAAALEWLGIDASVAGPELLESAREGAMTVPPLVRDLRAWLESNPGEATVEKAARALGVATRSLQRRLRDEATSFQQESRSALVRVAQRMLREPACPITRIALELGLTPAHFSAHFRRETGMSPTEWRRVNVRGS
jgi:AraC-like DNA-binding protein